jgi:hypothetical protein
MAATSIRKVQVMMGHFGFACKTPEATLIFSMNKDDVCKWTIVIRNLVGNDGEFEHGEYLADMIAPEGFPVDPPEFYFKTPNGVYDIDVKVCVSIGEYHKADFPAAMGMVGFATQLISGFIGWKDLGGGINILTTSAKKKSELAQASKAFNRKHYMSKLEELNSAFVAYSASWDLSHTPPKVIEKLIPLEDVAVPSTYVKLALPPPVDEPSKDNTTLLSSVAPAPAAAKRVRVPLSKAAKERAAKLATK